MKRIGTRCLGALRQDAQLRFGVIGLAILLLLCLLAPVLATVDPYYYGPDSLAAPGVSGHLLGTNLLGQDAFSMLV